MRLGSRRTKRFPRYRVSAVYVTDDQLVSAVMQEHIMTFKDITNMLNFMNPVLAQGWLQSIVATRECVITMVDSIDNGRLLKVYKFVRN